MWGVVGWFLGVLGGIGSAVAAALAAIWPVLLQMWSVIMSVFRRVGELFASIGRHVYDFASAVWSRVILPIVETIADWWSRFYDFLRTVLDPIIDRLEWLADLVEQFYESFVEPVFLWFDRARQILGGLSMLGVGWAETLIGVLNQIEYSVNNAFDTVVDYLYDITSILNDLLDPGGWIKWDVFGKSVYQWNGGIMAILVGVGIDPNLPARRARHKEEAEIPTLPTVRAEWADLVLHSHPAVQRAVKAFKEGQFSTGERIPWY